MNQSGMRRDRSPPSDRPAEPRRAHPSRDGRLHAEREARRAPASEPLPLRRPRHRCGVRVPRRHLGSLGPALRHAAGFRRLSGFPEAPARGTGGAASLAARQGQPLRQEPGRAGARLLRRSGDRELEGDGGEHRPGRVRGGGDAACAIRAGTSISRAGASPARSRAMPRAISASCAATWISSRASPPCGATG